MPRISGISLAVVLVIIAAVGLEQVDGGEAYWNEVDPGAGAPLLTGVGGMTAAEDALRILRSVPLTQLSAGQRRHVKRRILSVLGLDHVPRPVAERTRRGRRAAVAAYMMALYRGGTDHDEDASSTRTAVPEDWTDMGLLTSDWHQLTAADTVISFANQGCVWHPLIGMLELSFLRTFAPGNESSTIWNFRSQERKFLGTKVPATAYSTTLSQIVWVKILCGMRNTECGIRLRILFGITGAECW